MRRIRTRSRRSNEKLVETVLDRPRYLVDRACEALDPLDGLLGVSAGEVGDALAARLEADAAADDAGDALDDQLGLRAAVGLVVDAVRVGELVK